LEIESKALLLKNSVVRYKAVKNGWSVSIEKSGRIFYGRLWLDDDDDDDDDNDNLCICLHSGADKSLAFPISYFPICRTTKRIFLGRVKEVRTTKS
jgi:hypothetical protein